MAISTQGGVDSRDLSPSRAPSPPDNLPPPYQVHLPSFDGPLGLLLHLIERNQLEITTVSLVAVTDQFIQYLRTWDDAPPMPHLAEFVAMAARLVLIKSRCLLPRDKRLDTRGDEPDPLEEAEQLRRRLLEYKTARDIAEALRARESAGLQSFARPTQLMHADSLIDWRPPQIVGVDVAALAAVFQRVLSEQRFSQPEELPLPVVTIAEKIVEIERILKAQGRTTLEALLEKASGRLAVVVMFLAVLELWHQARLIAAQDNLFGSILIQPGPKFAEPGQGAG